MRANGETPVRAVLLYPRNLLGRVPSARSDWRLSYDSLEVHGIHRELRPAGGSCHPTTGSFALLGEAVTQPPGTLLRKRIPVANRCELYRI